MLLFWCMVIFWKKKVVLKGLPYFCVDLEIGLLDRGVLMVCRFIVRGSNGCFRGFGGNGVEFLCEDLARDRWWVTELGSFAGKLGVFGRGLLVVWRVLGNRR